MGIEKHDEWERKVKVMLTCTKDWCLEEEVESLNIEEDIEGRDVLTFTCPECGQVHQSFRVL